jgi:hypothetical protein
MAPCTTKPGLRLATHDLYTPIGHTSWGPIFPAQGGRASSRGVDFLVDDSDDDGDPFDGGGDDEDDDDGPDPEDDEQDDRDQRGRRDPRSRRQRDEGDEADDDGGEYEAPTREQWERVNGALKKANHEAGRRRLIAKKLERLGVDDDNIDDWLMDRGIDPSNGERLSDDSDPLDNTDGDDGRGNGRDRVQAATDKRRAEARGRAHAEARYKPGMAMFAAEAAIREAGWSGKDLGLALRLIDIGSVDVEFDGEVPTVHGLDEQVEQIKAEFPAWFRGGRPAPTEERRPARRTGGVREVDGGERRRSGGRQPTWKDLVDRQLTGRGRR